MKRIVFSIALLMSSGVFAGGGDAASSGSSAAAAASSSDSSTKEGWGTKLEHHVADHGPCVAANWLANNITDANQSLLKRGLIRGAFFAAVSAKQGKYDDSDSSISELGLAVGKEVVTGIVTEGVLQVIQPATGWVTNQVPGGAQPYVGQAINLAAALLVSGTIHHGFEWANDHKSK